MSYWNSKVSRMEQIKGEREIEKARQACLSSMPEPPSAEEVNVGGVFLIKSQIAKPIDVSSFGGAKVYNVEFKNGVKVSFMDQTDEYILEKRFNAPGRIAANGSDINIYNIYNGSMKGTSQSENIYLDLCNNFNVDGNGGSDYYRARHYQNESNNSYVMHVGDVYEKKLIDGAGSNYFPDFEPEFTMARYKEYSFRDVSNHTDKIDKLFKQWKNEQDYIVNRLGIVAKDKTKFDVNDVTPDIDNGVQNLKSKMPESEYGEKEHPLKDMFDLVLNFQREKIEQKMQDARSRNENMDEYNRSRFGEVSN